MANKKLKKKRRALRRSQAVLYLIMFFILLAIPVSNVYTNAILSKSTIALEDLKNDIEEQEKINESLKMEISELASLDTIQTVAQQNGLTYKNGNIKVVTNE